MKFILIFVTIIMVVGAQADESWPTFGNPFMFTEQGGEAIYRSVCAGCHMQDGSGARGAGVYPSLIKDPRLAAFSYTIDMVLKGQKAMPPFGHALSDEQIAAVVSYIRTHFGNGFDGTLTAADVAAER